MYASGYLQGKTVIMCHQDNSIGEGWEKVDFTVLNRADPEMHLTVAKYAKGLSLGQR